MIQANTGLAASDNRLDGGLLRTVDDVGNHRAGVEIAVVHNLAGAICIADPHVLIFFRLGVHPLNDLVNEVGDILLHPAACLHLGCVIRQLWSQVLAEDILRRSLIRAFNANLHIQASRAQNCRVYHFLAVGGTNHDDVFQPLYTVKFAEQLRDYGVFHIRGDTRTTSAENRVHLIEEDNNRLAILGNVTSTVENQTNLTLRLTDELV